MHLHKRYLLKGLCIRTAYAGAGGDKYQGNRTAAEKVSHRRSPQTKGKIIHVRAAAARCAQKQ
jgi:hypothetical protein